MIKYKDFWFLLQESFVQTLVKIQTPCCILFYCTSDSEVLATGVGHFAQSYHMHFSMSKFWCIFFPQLCMYLDENKDHQRLPPYMLRACHHFSCPKRYAMYQSHVWFHHVEPITFFKCKAAVMSGTITTWKKETFAYLLQGCILLFQKCIWN